MAQTYATTGAANVNYPADEGINYNGGERTFAIYGTWGGATIKLQASLDEGTNWIYLSDSEGAQLSFNDDAIFRINMGQCKLRFAQTGGNGSDTSLTIKVS
jgi:hypothetical protein